MKKSKIKLSYSIIFIICLGIIIFRFQNNKNNTAYIKENNQFQVNIIDYKIDGDKITIEAIGKEKLMIYYYFKTKEEKQTFQKKLQVGDTLKIIGNLKIPDSNQNLYGFNYRNYLLSKNIKWVLNADSILQIKHNHTIWYRFKNQIIQKLNKIDNHYLNLFIIGKNTLDNDIKNTYSKNGISHLFAISGMHISFLVIFLSKILKIWIKKQKIVTLLLSTFLLIFFFLTNFSPSVIRAGCMYILSQFFPKIDSTWILIIIGISLLMINPYYIYHLGFVFSFTISFSLIFFGKYIHNQTNYFQKLWKTSYISFLSSLPILIYQFHEVNFLSIFLNLIFVPFVSLIIFPFGILTFFFSFLAPIFNLLTNILEALSITASKINIFSFVFRHPKFIFIILYYFIIYLIFCYKKRYLIIFFIVLIFHYKINLLDPNLIISAISIGQGDSIFIKLPHNQGNILLDTGGKIEYEKEKWQISKNKTNLATNTIIPYLKAEGIDHLDYLILSHGDFDHMGESINLVNNFKIKKVIFNCGEYNDLEKKLIKVLNKKKIQYYSCISELNIDNNNLFFLQTKEYDNENDNSNIIYTELNNFKFLFMGDASKLTEKEILNKYTLPDIDVLKVGHHGSKTSSSQKFIDEINPKYSIISVGKNNRYGHPDEEVLNNLEGSKIYRTDLNGSVIFKIKKNKLKIKTCTP